MKIDRHGRLVVPDVLPAEFLTDSDSDSDSGKPSRKKTSSAQQLPLWHQRPKKITFDEDEAAARKRIDRVEARAAKGPHNERVGATVFKVVKRLEDPRAPPKAGRGGLASRLDLLARRRLPQHAKQAFFAKRK